MAYFANGTEGLYLEEQCEYCLHGIDDAVMCPVYLVQHRYNTTQLGPRQKQLKECLELLIDEHGNCLMKQAMTQCKVIGHIDHEIPELEKFNMDKQK